MESLPQNLSFYVYNTPFGRITLAEHDSKIVQLHFGDSELDGNRRATKLLNAAANQIQEYLAGRRTTFDVPVDPLGTPFQKDVWSHVMRVPYGTTCTCTQLAEDMGNPHSFRAVGVACKHNPLPLFIPTHRIVMASNTPRSLSQHERIMQFMVALEQRGAECATIEKRNQ